MGLRPEQKEIVAYTGGLAAVSAVPGSGKTHTLAALAASLLQRGLVPDDAEVLVVTFTTSAVDNIRSRIRQTLKQQDLVDTGYHVLTLHGLANLIVRERPDLAGTTADFRLDDELSGHQSMPDAARWYSLQHADFWRSFLTAEMTVQQREKAMERWLDATEQLGSEVTRLAKNLRRRPLELQQMLHDSQAAHGAHAVSDFLTIGAAIYERYDYILSLGGRLDYDDLIWRSIIALENDDGFRRRLTQRWPFILEDEAQDSTPLQELILSLLAREHNNWVRVGDSNQAIMTTFTASDVKFFREFQARSDVAGLPLSVSGRSAQKIIDTANRLADWAVSEHPEPEVRTAALINSVRIVPVEPGDPQQNPQDQEARIEVNRVADDDDEAERTARHAMRYVLDHPDRTCAILSPTNYQGNTIIQQMEKLSERYPGRILFQNQLRNSQTVRNVAHALAQAVRFCGTPTNTSALIELRKALIDLDASLGHGVAEARMSTLLRSLKPERLLFPSPLAEPSLPENVVVDAQERRELDELGARAAKWLRASVLPIDQLVLTVAQDVLSRDSELAIAHSMALSLRRLSAVNPQLQLLDMARELDEIAHNRQKYLSNALIESGFEPVPGVVTITTMHKAKGLEWDRVYLTSVDQIEFPHDAGGKFRGELWFLGGRDPATEARMQLEALHRGESPIPNDTELIHRARIEYISERLRLLYVGITRAKRDLYISYAHERRGQPNELAFAVSAVMPG